MTRSRGPRRTRRPMSATWPGSEDALAEFLQCRFRQRQPQPGLLLQLESPGGDLRRVFEQLGLERVALRIGERFDDDAGRAAGDDVGVDEAVVMGRDLHAVQLAERGELPPLGEA